MIQVLGGLMSQTIEPPTQTAPVLARLSAAVGRNADRLRTLAQEGRKLDPRGAILAGFDERQQTIEAGYFPCATVAAALATFDDPALSEAFALASLLAHAAPWQVIIVAAIVTPSGEPA